MGLLSGHLATDRAHALLLADSAPVSARLRHRGAVSPPRLLQAGHGLAVLMAGEGDMAGNLEIRSPAAHGLTVLCDARLTNGNRLAAELRAGGQELPSGPWQQSDAGIILAGWMAWGPGLLPRLRGAFAIVVLDAQRGTLTCARDRFGQRPLHYAAAGTGFAFASEIQALLAWPGVGREADLDMVAHALAFGHLPLDRGPLLGLGRVPPGHVLMRDAEGRVAQADWRLAPPELPETNSPAATLRSLVDAAVVDAMGAFAQADVLGDGLPASALVESLGRMAPQDDGGNLAEADGPVGDMPSLLALLLRHQGDPVVDMDSLHLASRAEASMGHGSGLLLSTAGAGELLLGHPRYDRFARDLAQMRVEGRPPAGWSGGFRDTAPFARDLFHAAGGNPGEAERFAVSGPALLHTLVFSQPDRLGPSLEAAAPEEVISLAARLDLGLRLPGRELTALDGVAALTGATIACPMLDEDLAQWCLAQTQTVRRRGPSGKEAPYGLLATIATAGEAIKPGPTMPASLRDFACDILLDRRCQERGLFGRDRLQAALRRYRVSEASGSVALWRMLNIELWFRSFVDADALLPFAAPTQARLDLAPALAEWRS